MEQKPKSEVYQFLIENGIEAKVAEELDVIHDAGSFLPNFV